MPPWFASPEETRRRPVSMLSGALQQGSVPPQTLAFLQNLPPELRQQIMQDLDPTQTARRVTGVGGTEVNRGPYQALAATPGFAGLPQGQQGLLSSLYATAGNRPSPAPAPLSQGLQSPAPEPEASAPPAAPAEFLPPADQTLMPPDYLGGGGSLESAITPEAIWRAFLNSLFESRGGGEPGSESAAESDTGGNY